MNKRTFLQKIPFISAISFIGLKQSLLAKPIKELKSPDRFLDNNPWNPVTVEKLNNVIKMLEQRIEKLED